MYKSPIELLVDDIQHQIVKKQDEDIYKAVLHYIPNVNKEELIRALQYDRNQYEKGYADGKADAMPSVVKYERLLEMYHDLRDNFVDYYCSGTQNVAPYCLNKCEECVDKWGYCKQYSDHCKGFNPAEVILDGAKMDGDGNA